MYLPDVSNFTTLLSSLSVLELVKLTAMLREYPEDEPWLNKALMEMRRRASVQ